MTEEPFSIVFKDEHIAVIDKGSDLASCTGWTGGPAG